MKIKGNFSGHFILTVLIIITALHAKAQQQFVQVADKKNNYCNSTCTFLDVAELNANPIAVIIASNIVENGVSMNPHLIGVHYINDKWSIINLDQFAIAPGSKFNVQYFAKPDPASQFVHIVTKESLHENNTKSFIDHPSLNNNPEAKFQYMVNGIGTGNNRYEVSTDYDKDAGKWYLYNAKKKAFDYNVSYNIVIGSGRKQKSVPAPITEMKAATSSIDFGNVVGVWMSVEGMQQGNFKGETLRTGMANKMELKGFDFEINLPIDPVTGQTSGKRQRPPIIIRKQFGAASLQFQQSITRNENIKTIIIEFYASDQSGHISIINTIKLTNCRFVHIQQSINNTTASTTLKDGMMEEIKIVYQKIETTDQTGFIITDDSSIQN
ncbi:MAG: type VI secretion system tube protein TssD [Ferruginibacter sp.]